VCSKAKQKSEQCGERRGMIELYMCIPGFARHTHMLVERCQVTRKREQRRTLRPYALRELTNNNPRASYHHHQFAEHGTVPLMALVWTQCARWKVLSGEARHQAKGRTRELAFDMRECTLYLFAAKTSSILLMHTRAIVWYFSRHKYTHTLYVRWAFALNKMLKNEKTYRISFIHMTNKCCRPHLNGTEIEE